MRKEEKRFRDALMHARRKAAPDIKLYIRSGKLFCDNDVIDQLDIVNQLF